jgi:hypothetical protein
MAEPDRSRRLDVALVQLRLVSCNASQMHCDHPLPIRTVSALSHPPRRGPCEDNGPRAHIPGPCLPRVTVAPRRQARLEWEQAATSGPKSHRAVAEPPPVSLPPPGARSARSHSARGPAAALPSERAASAEDFRPFIEEIRAAPASARGFVGYRRPPLPVLSLRAPPRTAEYDMLLLQRRGGSADAVRPGVMDGAVERDTFKIPTPPRSVSVPIQTPRTARPLEGPSFSMAARRLDAASELESVPVSRADALGHCRRIGRGLLSARRAILFRRPPPADGRSGWRSGPRCLQPARAPTGAERAAARGGPDGWLAAGRSAGGSRVRLFLARETRRVAQWQLHARAALQRAPGRNGPLSPTSRRPSSRTARAARSPPNASAGSES